MVFPKGLEKNREIGAGSLVIEDDYLIYFKPNTPEDIKQQFIKDYAEYHKNKLKSDVYRPVILDRFVDSNYLSEYNGFFNQMREDLVDDALDFVNNNMIGTNKTEKSIVSASYGANVLTDRAIHIRLHCPKGTHLFVTKNKRESEVLFHDGLTYEIISASKEMYKHHSLFTNRYRLVLNVVVKNNGL